jgi:hypothetical protein
MYLLFTLISLWSNNLVYWIQTLRISGYEVLYKNFKLRSVFNTRPYSKRTKCEVWLRRRDRLTKTGLGLPFPSYFNKNRSLWRYINSMRIYGITELKRWASPQFFYCDFYWSLNLISLNGRVTFSPGNKGSFLLQVRIHCLIKPLEI